MTPAKLKGALLTAREAGTGWTLVSTGSGSGTSRPGPTTTQPKGGNSSPSLANVHTTPQCKALLSNFDLTSPVKNTAQRESSSPRLIRLRWRRCWCPPMRRGLRHPRPRAGIAKCKKISITTGVGRATVDLAPIALPKLGDDSLGVKLTVTVTGQGKTVVLNEYLALIQRGNTVDALVLGDAPANGGPVKKVNPATLGPLAQKADAKVAKVT